MDKEIWGILGILLGFLGKGLFDLIRTRMGQDHNEKMYLLENQGKENVKEILLEMLNHRKYVDRNFDTLKKRIGGYSDDEIRRILIEINAQRVGSSNSDKEQWFLSSRGHERDTRANRNLKAEKTK